MKRVAILAACLLTSLVPTASLQAEPSRDRSLHAFLQREFRDERQYPDVRYMAAWVDLDGDRRPEAIVYLRSQGYCGTGGCSLFIYRNTGRSWREVANMSVSWTPIRVLATRSRGWRDLGISQSELRGDHFVRYEARLRFNGRTYPMNPSVPPAERLARRVAGQVLIADGDRGRRLF